MRNDRKRENHHYVPKMLLREFAFQKKKNRKTFVYDKSLGKSLHFPTAIDNLASETSFYDFDIDEDNRASFEGVMNEVENLAKGPLDKVRLEQGINGLSPEEMGALNVFVMAQYLRGKGFRNSVESMDNQIKSHVRRVFGDDDAIYNVENWKPFADENEIKHFSIYFFRNSLAKFSQILCEKICIVQRTRADDPFWISDNPVTLYNDPEDPELYGSQEFPVRGNLGLSCLGIQLHLPISPTLCLCYWCPSILGRIEENANEIRRIKKRFAVSNMMTSDEFTMKNVSELLGKEKLINKILNSINMAETLDCIPTNVQFLNSLQYQHAHRFIMSKTPKFDLAEEIYRDGLHRKAREAQTVSA